MGIKLVAFDWNGTILADAQACVQAEDQVLKEWGFGGTNLKQFQKTYTIPIVKYWSAMGFDPEYYEKNSDDIHRTFIKYYEPLEKKCRSRSGSREILKWLAQNGIDSVIFSNHTTAHIEQQLNRLKLDPYIKTVIGRSIGDYSHLITRSKDTKLNDLLKSRGLRANETLVVGDTIEEIEIAAEHGYTSVALTGGWNSTKRLKAANPDYLVHNLKELATIIKKINSDGRTYQRNKITQRSLPRS